MDFSTFLILPLSMIVAFTVMIGAAILKRPAPLLIWPSAFSTIAVVLVFLGLPNSSTLGLWVMTVFSLAFSAAIGTVAGGLVARAIIRVAVTLR